ncbi:MAG: helix-turn-helix domain-containing protein [Flavobacteriales bacterium]|jgi:AraC-like DNA-binding protein|nr:helix-turn-helix domain-containing protein [Flavobacteriales bacterium]
MIDQETYTLVNSQTGELAFKLYKFESIRHLDHIQRLNYYSLIWIKSGEGNALIEDKEYSYKKNDLFSFSPYQPFMFKSLKKTSGIIINFHSDFFCIYKHHKEIACDGVLFNNIYDTPIIKINDSYFKKLDWIVQEIIEDIQQNNLAYNEAIISHLKIFLINISRLKKEQNPIITTDELSEDRFITQKLKNYIEQYYKKKHQPKEYAELLHLTPNSLAKITKKYFNKTLSTLIAERIIIEAKRELYLSSKSVEEIAFELGYEDPFYFSRFFKKHTEIAPSVYRKTVGFDKANY